MPAENERPAGAEYYLNIDFLLKEVRYSSLKAASPEDAEALYQAAEENAKWRYDGYVRRTKIEY